MPTDSDVRHEFVGLPPSWNEPYALPLAISPAGGYLAWRPLEIAHALVAGPPQGGTTSVIRTIVVTALISGWRVSAVDPVHTSLQYFADWPGIAGFSSVPEEALAVIRAHRDDMRRCQRHPTDGVISTAERPHLLVVPEVDELLAVLPQEDRDRASRLLWEVTRTGRATKHWQLLGLRDYRVARRTIPGTARDCVGTRVHTGVQTHRPGGLLIETAGGAATGLGIWTPDPNWPRSSSDKVVLEQLKQLAAKAQVDAGALQSRT